MNYKMNTDDINTNGTCLQGCIDISYGDITEVLGGHQEGDGDKVDAEWILEFEDGTVATIYNWKDGKNYLGAEGLDVEEIRDWHIGGKSKDVVAYVYEIFD